VNVICVIGDVVGSRSVRDRSHLQAQLQGALDAVNRARRKLLISPCTITLGDEFQAVYRSADSLFSDFWMIMHELYPVKLRFSVGVGPLTTPLNRQRAIGMDGPAFYAARAGLTELKDSGFTYRITDASAALPQWVNLTLDLISHESAGWKKTRLAVLHELLEERAPREAAAAVKLTEAAIYKNIRSGALRTIKALLGEITAAIGERVATPG
jgi:hypothetical protein